VKKNIIITISTILLFVSCAIKSTIPSDTSGKEIYSKVQREHRAKAMMHRFFSLYEIQNKEFSLVRELLYEDGFVWNSPSGNLVGLPAFNDSFNKLNKTWRHSHNASQMTVTIMDKTRLKLSFDYIYQHVQGKKMALHAKGHYEIIVVDNGETFPRIQKCDLTLLGLIKGGKFVDLYKKNNHKFLMYQKQSLKE
jgi:hypothetical protein